MKTSTWFMGGELNGPACGASQTVPVTQSTLLACLLVKYLALLDHRENLQGSLQLGSQGFLQIKSSRSFVGGIQQGEMNTGACTFYPKPHISDSKNDSKKVHRLYAY